MLKPLTVWITTNCGKFLKRWEYQTTRPASWEIYMQVRKQQNWTWNNRLVQIGKGVHQGCILSLSLFNLYAEYIIQNARLDEAKPDSRLPGEIYVFLELSCFFHDPVDVGNLISRSCAFSKTSLNIWKFTVHVLSLAWRILSITLLVCEMSVIGW